MKVADLEIVVSLKGASDVGTGLRHVDSGLENVKSMALETKAAILGVIYGLEQMATQSLQTGASLQTFGNLTGLDPVALQKWQYALQQSFVDANKTTSAVVALQQKMSEVIVKGTGITGMQPVFEAAGIDEKRIRDTFYVLGKLREYAQAHKATPDITRNLMGNLLPQEVIQALMTGNFDPEKTPRSQLYSKGQTGALAAGSVQLKNLATKWEHFFGTLTAEHGGNFIADLTDLSNALINLALALDKVATSLGAFTALHELIHGTAEIFRGKAGLSSMLKGGASADPYKSYGGSAPLLVQQTNNNVANVQVHGAENAGSGIEHGIKEIHRAFRDINSVAGKQNN